MKTFHYFFVLLSVFLISCESEKKQQTDTTVAIEINNVSYGNDPQQRFDIYLPADRNTTDTKTIILVHGGGWTSGDKVDMAHLVSFIKMYLPGYAVVNVNYRLATQQNRPFPMQINDIKAVIQKLKNSGYGISKEFGFIGASAGAHLAMLYGYDNDPNHEVKMICSIVGPTDFTDANYQNDPIISALFDNVTGETYEENPEFYRSVSPLFHATASSPPTILFYGNADPLVPTSQGISLQAKLDELNVENQFTLYNGGHGNWSETDYTDAYTKLIAFTTTHL